MTPRALGEEGRPVKRLREKWNSSRGASILVALLLLLVCMMVASSVLMAAASNAGKLSSSRVEHQKYLTLSSALRLVCGELQESSYRGKYSYEKKEVEVTREDPVLDEEGNPKFDEHKNPMTVVTVIRTYHTHTYTQTAGEYKCGLSSVIPLLEKLDYLFQKKLTAGVGVDEDPSDEYIYEPCSKPLNFNFPIIYTLTVEAADFDKVTVKFQLREDGIITLTASLPKDESGHVYAMEAELKPVEPLNKVLVLSGTEGENKTKEVKWELNWISKKGA